MIISNLTCKGYFVNNNITNFFDMLSNLDVKLLTLPARKKNSPKAGYMTDPNSWNTVKDSIHLLSSEANNIGLGLFTSRVFVIDFDPKTLENQQGIEKFITDFDLTEDVLSAYPQVQSGWRPTIIGTNPNDSMGRHIYMTLPVGADKIRGSSGYKGVDIKHNGYVVSPGSIHPDSGEKYVLLTEHHENSKIPVPPEKLGAYLTAGANAIFIAQTEGGVMTSEELEIILNNTPYDGYDSGDYNNYIKLLFAAHHATDGDKHGLQKFINWASGLTSETKSDPVEITKKWKGMSAKCGERPMITWKSLRKHMPVDFNPELKGHSQEYEFEEATTDMFKALGRVYTPGVSKLEFMNDVFFPIESEGQAKYAYIGRQGTFIKITAETLMEKFSIWKLGEKNKSLPGIWRTWGLRNSDFVEVFEPTPRFNPLFINKAKGKINLWQGYATEPQPVTNKIHIFLNFVKTCIAANDETSYKYIMSWLAFKIQKPHLPPGVAICLTGAKGAGKSTLAEIMIRIVGDKNVATDNSVPMQVLGRFNSCVKHKILSVLEEFTLGSGSDKEALDNKFKNLITSPRLAIENKGKDVTPDVPNYLGFIIISNDLDTLSVDKGERRYAIFRVSGDKSTSAFGITNEEKEKRVAFWAELLDFLDNQNGLNQILQYLLDYDIAKFDPRNEIPETFELIDMKKKSTPGSESFLKDLKDSNLFSEATVYSMVTRVNRNGAAASDPVVSDYNNSTKRFFITARELSRVFEKYWEENKTASAERKKTRLTALLEREFDFKRANAKITGDDKYTGGYSFPNRSDLYIRIAEFLGEDEVSNFSNVE
jgi:energy-coupling factor transporter ATP-binding protein EcfA2